MSVSLNNLVQRVMREVPARDGIPSDEQVIQAVVDAVAELGRRRSIVRRASLSVVSGTATYELPADFVDLVSLDSPVDEGGVIVTGAGLVPVGSGWSEEYTIAGGQITFTPTPAYTATRWYTYKAGYALGADNVYADLDDAGAKLTALLASAECLYLQANRAAADAWQYQFGDERVSKEKLAGELRAQAQALEARFDKGVEASTGTIGMRATYPDGSYS